MNKKYNFLNVILGEDAYNKIIYKGYDTIVVSLSGGFDSTLVFCKILDLIKNNKLNTKVIGIRCSNQSLNSVTSKKEKEALVNIDKELKKLGYDNFEIINLNNEFTDINDNALNGKTIVQKTIPLDKQYATKGLSQPTMWIYNMIPFLSPNTAIVFGYIQGDDLLSRYNLDYFSNSIDNIIGMMSLNLNDRLSMLLPLAYYDKAEVLRILKDKFPTIYELPYTCQLPYPDGTPCGECHSCKSKIIANFENKIYNGDDIKMNIDFQLPPLKTYNYYYNDRLEEALTKSLDKNIYSEDEKSIIGVVTNVPNDKSYITVAVAFNNTNISNYILVYHEYSNKICMVCKTNNNILDGTFSNTTTDNIRAIEYDQMTFKTILEVLSINNKDIKLLNNGYPSYITIGSIVGINIKNMRIIVNFYNKQYKYTHITIINNKFYGVHINNSFKNSIINKICIDKENEKIIHPAIYMDNISNKIVGYIDSNDYPYLSNNNAKNQMVVYNSNIYNDCISDNYNIGYNNGRYIFIEKSKKEKIEIRKENKNREILYNVSKLAIKYNSICEFNGIENISLVNINFINKNSLPEVFGPDYALKEFLIYEYDCITNTIIKEPIGIVTDFDKEKSKLEAYLFYEDDDININFRIIDNKIVLCRRDNNYFDLMKINIIRNTTTLTSTDTVYHPKLYLKDENNIVGYVTISTSYFTIFYDNKININDYSIGIDCNNNFYLQENR